MMDKVKPGTLFVWENNIGIILEKCKTFPNGYHTFEPFDDGLVLDVCGFTYIEKNNFKKLNY